MAQLTHDRLKSAYLLARDALLAERTPQGYWVGELSSSALSTAVAMIALHIVDAEKHATRIQHGGRWLIATQNADGGWGDTTKSFSNISTSMLVRAAWEIVQIHDATALAKLESYLSAKCGRTTAERAEAIRRRYGPDRTFSVPILMTCALAKLVPWREVPRLPFELACLPQSWYRFAGLPVVSYALPALIAIGQVIEHYRPSWNPLRKLAKSPSLEVLRTIQPSSGGYLEATPLTAFVTMSLASCGHANHDVVQDAVRFLVNSVRADGSWPIDTNLSIWVTTLSVNALAAAGDLESLPNRVELRDWLLNQQTREPHPYTGAAPGAWGWSDEPGSVPDCDDTPGAILALRYLEMPSNHESIALANVWMRDLRNRDGGQPTFCRGWGKLPFDRSGCDLTAHAIRAWGDLTWCRDGFAYLAKEQRPDGSWLPLWFGNQHAPDDINPVYGTARVLAAYRDLRREHDDACRRGVAYLLSVQNADGGWGGAAGCPSSVEETAVVVEVLLELMPSEAVWRGVAWLVEAVETGRFRDAAPIGFYFAKLWYYEKLYPIIFTVAALGRARLRL